MTSPIKKAEEVAKTTLPLYSEEAIQKVTKALLSFSLSQMTPLVVALSDAIGMVTSEYCSHQAPCGADTEYCYAKEFYKVLAHVEQLKTLTERSEKEK